MPVELRKDSTHTHYRFDTWEDWVEYCAGDTDCPDSKRYSRRTTKNHRDTDMSWFGPGAGTFTDAMELARYGWDAVRPEVSKVKNQISTDLKLVMTDTFVQVNDVSGVCVDIDRFIAGEPESMVTLLPIKSATVGKVISILVNGIFSAGVKSTDIMKRGTAVAALVEVLDLLQHGTEVWVEVNDDGTNSNLDYVVCVKRASESLDLARLLFAVAHPAAFRRLTFSAMERETSTVRRAHGVGEFQGGYGSPRKCQMADVVGAHIVLDLMSLGMEPERWVREQLGAWGLLKVGGTEI